MTPAPTEHLCPACRQPAPTTTLCWDCAKRLHRLLARLAEDIAELHTQLTRQSRQGRRTAGRSAERPLPYDTTASDVLADVRSVLVGWTRVAVEHDGPPFPADTEPAMLRHLRRTHWQTHPAADELLDELTWLHERVIAAIDSPAERRYLGPCGSVDIEGVECAGDVYAVGGRTPRCRDCGGTYSRDERLAWIADLAAGQLVTASEAAGALSAWGQCITSDLVAKWAQRGRLASRGADGRGRRLYSFAECRALAAETVRRRGGKGA